MSDDPKRGDLLKPIEIAGFGQVEDSRLKGYRGTITHPTLPLERTFCSSCGAPYGWVSTESSGYIAAGEVVVFCDACEANMNKLGGVPLPLAAPKEATEIPEPLRRGSLPSRLGE
jgi:hypothetical protein